MDGQTSFICAKEMIFAKFWFFIYMIVRISQINKKVSLPYITKNIYEIQI